jgi:hypothetical protein
LTLHTWAIKHKNPAPVPAQGLNAPVEVEFYGLKWKIKRKESHLIFRKSFTIPGVVLVLFGLYVLATITSLVQAYMPKPDEQNGGIVILSRFVRINYTAALIIAVVAGFLF